MKLVNTGNENGKWDDVMTQIAHWLTRHLDDSNLILWVAKHGGQLHPQFARLIRNRAFPWTAKNASTSWSLSRL